MKEYKRIFDIVLNDKIFSIFIDNEHRFTFLQKNELNQYIYPELNDFLLLHNTFNNRKSYISYEIPRYTFIERVRYGTAAVLMVLVVGLHYTHSNNYETKIDDNNLFLEEIEQPSYIEIKNSSDFAFLGLENLNLEDIHSAIDTNNNTFLEYKVLSHMIANELYYKYPKADLRIFYLNARDLLINEITSEKLQQETKQVGVGANFDASISTINAPADCDSETKAHELGHSVTTLWKYINGVLFNKSCSFGYSLDEAMNNKIVDLVVDHDSYEKHGAVLDYFCTCVPFSIEDYVNNNIAYLINLLKEKYPTVDIDYIVSTLDAMMDTRINFGIEVSLDANVSFLDEMFLICKQNVQTSVNYYSSFTEFAKLLEYTKDKDLYFKYLKEYNDYLLELGVKNIVTKDDVLNKWAKLQNVRGFAFDDEGFYPVLSVETIYNGNKVVKSKVLKNGEYLDNFNGQTSVKNGTINYLLHSIPEYYSIIGTNNYWKLVAVNSRVIEKKDVEPLEFNLNGNLVFKEYLRNVMFQVGLTSDGKIGYMLKNNTGDILYLSSPNLKNISSNLPFKYFFGLNGGIQSVELSTYLNESYLKLFVLEHEHLLPNVSVENNQVIIEPNYTLKIVSSSGIKTCGLFDMYLELNADNNIELKPLKIVLSEDIGLNEYPSIKSILQYYNVINIDTKEYILDEEELINYVKTYLNEIALNQAR